MTRSGLSTHRDIIDVQLDGHLVAVPVEIEYIIERFLYGADADGHWGVVREEVMVLDASICPGRLLLGDLTSEDVEEALAVAKRHICEC